MSDPDNVSVTTPKHPLTLGAARSVFRPYGEEQTANFNLATLDESKGFIGERFYAEAGLQYLNARYYDPKLGMFIQPDWWEVARAGVGTNRYGYAFGDPVHGRDPTGHSWEGNKHEKPDAPSGGGWSSDRLQRERNGWHDSTYNWSRGSWNVKIGELYISYKVYDSLFGGLAAEKPDLNPGAATRSSKPRVTGPGYQTGVPYNKVTDAIKRTSGLDLSATEDGLSGSIAVGCDLSASFCDRVISGMNSINMTYGRYSIDINFYLNNKEATIGIGILTQASGGQWVESTRTLSMSHDPNQSFWDVSVKHETFHALGVMHAPAGSGSLMSYDTNRRDYLTEDEVGRLISAY